MKSILRKRYVAAFVIVAAFMGIVYLLFGAHSVETFSMPVNKRVIMIDPGHGGWDPGKVAGKVNESDINLSISLKLQELLEQGGATVFMTRVDDSALGDTKAIDMSRRVQIANNADCEVTLSIHQNSYHTPDVSGPQVFYDHESERGQLLAEVLQNKLESVLGENKKREARPNPDYYMLKRTRFTSVIVECGFLSNASDRSKLTSEKYQDKVAWALYLGLVEYFSK